MCPSKSSRTKSHKTNREFDRRVNREVQRSKTIMVIATGGTVLNNLIKWGALATIAWAVAWAWVKSAPSIGGQSTQLSFTVGTVFRAFANQWAYLTVAGLCGAGWLIERRALRRRIHEMAEEKKQLEARLDPERSTSGMRHDGTGPED